MRKRKTPQIDEEKLHKATETMRALAHPFRMKILELIEQKGTLTSAQIYEHFDLESSYGILHLKLLRKTGLLLTTRRGKFIYYEVNHKKIGKAVKAVKRFLKDE